jgi:outer membrane protein assembly factor BamE (lipoprotein component of BamABCDE complex)
MAGNSTSMMPGKRAQETASGPRARTAQARLWVLGGVLCLLAACATIVRNHGYVPDETELSLIEVGVDTRETVAEKIGRPTAQGLLNDVGWFYIQSRFEHIGPREPQEVERQVVAITFSEGGTVDNIGRFGLEDGRVVEISRRVTETNIKGIGFIRQLFSNFGRIRAGDILGG